LALVGLDCQSPGGNAILRPIYFCLLRDSSMLIPNALAYQQKGNNNKNKTKQQQQQNRQCRKLN